MIEKHRIGFHKVGFSFALVSFLFLFSSLLFYECGGRGRESKEEFSIPDNIQREDISGSGYRAVILIDKNGLPHIKSDDAESGFFALGYIMAKMRYAQMDLLRVIANGLSSSLIDIETARKVDANTIKTIIHIESGELVPDVQWKILQENYPSEARIFSAFIKGINFFIDRLADGQEKLPPEYSAILSPRKPSPENKQNFYFTPSQILAISRFESWYLTGEGDISFDTIVSKIRKQVEESIWNEFYSELLTARAGVNIFTLPSPNYAPFLSSKSRKLYKINPFLSFSGSGSGLKRWKLGSNNWVISPSISEGGMPMVANDPHLPLFNPPLWFPWKGEMGDNFYEGFALVGIPGVLAGTNGKVAWGITNAGFDSLDLYREKIRKDSRCESGFSAIHNPSDPSDDMCIMKTQKKIGSSSKPEITIFYCKKHGVVLGKEDDVILRGEIPLEPDLSSDLSSDSDGEYYITFRWNGHEASSEPFFFFRIINSKSVDEFMQNITGFEVAPINYVFADLSGNIGYGSFALLPKRDWDLNKYPPISVLPTDGCCDWNGWVEKEKFPHVKNPAKGFVVTANNDLPGYTGDGNPFDDPVYLFWSYDAGYRVAEITYMIEEKIKQKGKISLSDMKDIQHDTVSYWTRGVLPWVRENLQSKEGEMSNIEKDAFQILKDWDMTCLSGFKLDNLEELTFSEISDERTRKNSSGCTIFWVFVNRLIINTFSDELYSQGVSISDVSDDYFLKQIYFYATGNYRKDFFDDLGTPEKETADYILYKSFSEAVSYLSQKFGNNTSNWLWGKIAKMKLYHFVSQAGLSIYDIGPFPIDLGPVSPAVAWVSITSDDPQSGFIMTGGPSMRVVYIPKGERFVSIFSFPGGVAGFGENGLTKPDTKNFFSNLLSTYFGSDYISFSEFAEKENFVKAIQILP